uniref:Uncharacterized protein n=1 Tax=Parascaris equorum TaxID=6256 RepID=A0A914S6A9_PAREQ
MAGMGFDQRNNFQNTPNMGGGGAPMNGRSNGAPFPSPPHGFAVNQQHPSPGGPLFGSAFPFNNNFTGANNNQIGFSNARFMQHDNNHGVPPTPMNSPAFWQGPPNMNGIVTSPFGTHSYGNAGMIATQYAFGGSNIIATIESTPEGAARILIGEGPAGTLQVTVENSIIAFKSAS